MKLYLNANSSKIFPTLYFSIVWTIKVPITPLLFLLHNRIQLLFWQMTTVNLTKKSYKKVKQRLKENVEQTKKEFCF